jgi:energy-coupling factor transport system permease protein
MKNSKAWIIWLIATIAIILSNRNPLYLLVLLIGLMILGGQLAREKKQKSWVLNNIRFLGTMVILSAVINALFTHMGSSVIFRFPETWLLIGGKITFESLIYGVLNGLVIGSLYIAFNIFNLALSIKQITALIPKIFHPIAITITIALTFFPSVQQRAREIKEAQLIRGNQMKRIVDWLPLLGPLLITSLERAFSLSESMTARDYHSQTKSLSGLQVTFPIIIATFLIFSGWILRLYDYPSGISLILYFVSGLTILLSIFFGNKKIKMTHYHKETWLKREFIVSAIFVGITFIWVLLQTSGELSSVSYSPYPNLTLPEFQLSGMLLSTSSILPVIFLHK